ncbi:hypothetical protein DFJ74DRAFT_710008 [Hyaloraphidium curvatum]|nr:hypothetical protein DFJ74DRAFT_710008 [Hyaloraphidium curvatum]
MPSEPAGAPTDPGPSTPPPASPPPARVRIRRSAVANPCRTPGCPTEASFDHEGSTGAGVRCGLHKLPGMISMLELCAAGGCRNGRWYVRPGQPRRSGVCERHRRAGMVPIVRRHCEAPGCREMPVFGAHVGAPARFCGEHKTDGQLDVGDQARLPEAVGAVAPGAARSRKVDATHARRDKECRHPEGCTKRASFFFEDPEHPAAPVRPTRCGQHRLPGQVDTQNRCAVPGCNLYGWYQHEGKSTERGRCAAHREPGMVAKARRKCEAVGCGGRPTHGAPGGPGRLCEQHALAGFVDVSAAGTT